MRPALLTRKDEGMSIEEAGRERWLEEQPKMDLTATVYRERHHVIAHLAAAYPSVMMLNADPEEPDWPVLFVTLPTGQVSWHIAPRDMDLFRHVRVGSAEWDGHDVEEKYRRLDEHTRVLAASGGLPGPGSHL